MAIPPRNRLLILNIAIFSERRDFKEFTKILSRRRASLYLTINKFFQKIEKFESKHQKFEINFRYIHSKKFKTASIRSLRNPTFYL